MADALRAKEQQRLEAKQAEWATKKWMWIIDAREGCVPAYIVKEAGDEVTLKLNDGNERTVNKTEIEPMNPPKFEKCEDMAQLTHLNESSVLHNLRDRYMSNLIYTYSGLFLVVINPWKRLPLYTDEIVAMYKGKKRRELPPHIFAVCDEAYRDMLLAKENQSLLITGESGAGKTENTKKVIQYLASVAGTHGVDSKLESQGQLEKQIIQSNPLLEAFGNAKTIRNNNSSRFGKFIRIEFGADGKIVGCNIDNYLLEKSRVVRHAQNERSFHIFYQLLEGASADQRTKYLLEAAKSYRYLENSAKIEGGDDAAEFRDTLGAMNTIGFKERETEDLFRILSGILHLGNLAFTQGKRDDAANIKDSAIADKISHTLGIKSPDFTRCLLKPRVKAGREWVTAMVTASKKKKEVHISLVEMAVVQAEYSTDALAKAIYDRLFKWIVQRINDAMVTHGRSANFIGCLDIAGFEIFELNSFEQLCINLTNEKLQQFFNHHMFVLEQEEYLREGIQWKFVDFGHDLQPAIDLIEKPMGIMSILDEESFFPQATDKSFIEKLHQQHEGKSPKYSKLRLNPTMFSIAHYAGLVEYETVGWLDKNKDPINDNVAALFFRSTNELMAKLFEDADDDENSEKRRKSSIFVTVGARHRTQLTALLTTLKNTSPHFVRCIIPNEQKKAGIIDAPLVLDQLRCNGVLEGIRIVRLGFPNRQPFAEFRQRYELLAVDAIPKQFMDSKVACEKLITALKVDPESYRIGASKVFFKSGVIAELEERRDQKLGQLISGFQAVAQGYLARKRYRRSHGREDAIRAIQRNALVFIDLYQWPWWKLYRQIAPLSKQFNRDEEERKLRSDMAELARKYEKEHESLVQLEAKVAAMEKSREELEENMQATKNILDETREMQNQTEEARRKIQTERDELIAYLDELEAKKEQNEAVIKKTQDRVKQLEAEGVEKDNQISELDRVRREQEKAAGELQRSLANEGSAAAALMAEKKAADEKLAQLAQELEALKKAKLAVDNRKAQLEAEVAKLSKNLDDETEAKAASEKSRRKLEDDLKKMRDAQSVLQAERTSLSDAVAKRDQDVSRTAAELAEAESRRAQLEKSLKSTKADLDAKEEELNQERRAKAVLEATKKKLEKDLDQLKAVLEDGSAGREAAEEMRRVKETELEEVKTRLTREKDQLQASTDSERKRLKAELAALQEQFDELQAAVARLRKELETARVERDELTVALESSERAKQALDKQNRKLAADLKEAQTTLAEEGTKARLLEDEKRSLQSQLSSLTNKLADGESSKGAVQQLKKSLEAELQDLRDQLAEANRLRLAAEKDKKTLQAQVGDLEDRLNDEEDSRKELEAALAEKKQQISDLEKKLEGDVLGKAKELEISERRLRAQLEEVQLKLDEAERSNEDLAKLRTKLTGDLASVTLQLEAERRANADNEKAVRRIKQTEDKKLLDASETERKSLSYQARASDAAWLQLEELRSALDKAKADGEVLNRAKKSLEAQLDRLSDELGEDGKNVSETRKANKKLESTIDRLQASEAELKQLLSQLEDAKLRSDKQIADLKERLQRESAAAQDQLAEARRDAERELALLNERLDEESRARSAALSARKDLEMQLAERQALLDSEARQRGEQAKHRKRFETQARDLQNELDKERSRGKRLEDLLKQAEGKAAGLAEQLQVSTAEIDRLTRTRKALEAEIENAKERDTFNDNARTHLQTDAVELAAAVQSKRELEAELRRLSDVLEESTVRRENLEAQVREHANETELLRKRTESEHQLRLQKLEEAKRVAERQVIELSARLDDQDKERAALLRSKDALAATIEDLNGRLEEHGRNLVQGAADRKKLLNDLKDLQAKLEQERFAKAELERSLAKSASVVEQLKERVASTDAARLASERAHAATKSDLEQLEFQLAQEARERTRLETENRELLSDADQLREKIEGQLEELAELRGLKRMQKDALDALRLQLEGQLQDKESELEALRVRHAKEVLDLKTVIAERDDRLNETRENALALESDVNTLHGLLEKEGKVNVELSQRLERQQARAADLQKSLEAAHLAEVDAENGRRTLGLELQTVKERLERELAATAAAEAESAELLTELEKLQDQLAAANELKAGAEAKNATLLEREAGLKEALDAEQERRADTEQRKADVDRLLEQSQLDLRKEAEISASLEKSKASLERQVKELKDKLEDIELGKSAGAQRTVMRLEARVEELQTRLQSETTARSTAVKEKRGAERELSEIQLKVDELAKEKAVLEEQSRKYEARLKSLRTQLVQAEGKVTEANIGASKLERETLAERERAASLARENDRLQARLEVERKETKELEGRLQAISGGLAASTALASAPRSFERTSQPVVTAAARSADSGERSAPVLTRRPTEPLVAASPSPAVPAAAPSASVALAAVAEAAAEAEVEAAAEEAEEDAAVAEEDAAVAEEDDGETVHA